MNVSLTRELEQLVEAKVESGRYTSASEVVREALRIMQEQDEIRRIKFDSLKSESLRGARSELRGDHPPRTQKRGRPRKIKK